MGLNQSRKISEILEGSCFGFIGDFTLSKNKVDKAQLVQKSANSLDKDTKYSGIDIAYRTNSRGLIEGYDKETGEVLVVQASNDDLLETSNRRLVEATRSDGTKVLVEKGIGLGSYDTGSTKQSMVSFYLALERYITGISLKNSLESVGLRYSDFCYLKSISEEAREMYKQAKRDRAEYLYDKALVVAEESGNDRLVVDTMKWSAEKGDPSEFGNKTTVSGDKDNPLQIVIDTGIRREGDEGFRDVEEEEMNLGESSKEEVVDLELEGDIFKKDSNEP